MRRALRVFASWLFEPVLVRMIRCIEEPAERYAEYYKHFGKTHGDALILVEALDR